MTFQVTASFLLFLCATMTMATPQKMDMSLGKALKKYRRAQGIKMVVKKTAHLKVLDKTTVSKGNLRVSQGRLRLHFSKPQSHLMVVNKKQVWIETKDVEFDTVQVLKGPYGQVYKKTGGLVALLFGENHFLNDMNVKNFFYRKDNIIYTLVPKQRSTLKNLKTIVVEVDTKRRVLKKIEYMDDIDNKITYLFSQIHFVKRMKDRFFVYKPPKGAEVVDF